MRCIIGLGNPGPQYVQTRHNVGFRVVDVLAERHRLPEPQRMMQAILGRGKIGGAEVIVVKPMTFMNESGRAVARICMHYELTPSDLLIVCDDINLDLGMLRLRRSGSAGGQKGIESIIDYLGTEEFPRLRLGLGRLDTDRDAKAFVLSPFEPEEEATADEMTRHAAEAVECILAEGLETAMNRFNE